MKGISTESPVVCIKYSQHQLLLNGCNLFRLHLLNSLLLLLSLICPICRVLPSHYYNIYSTRSSSGGDHVHHISRRVCCLFIQKVLHTLSCSRPEYSVNQADIRIKLRNISRPWFGSCGVTNNNMQRKVIT